MTYPLYYSDADSETLYSSIEEVLMTTCHICGEKLEWSFKVDYNSLLDIPVITGSAISCGIKYYSYYDNDNNCYRINIYV